MDVECRYACITPLDSKQAEGVLEAIQRFWKQVGPPDFLQMDNELCFRGVTDIREAMGRLFAIHCSRELHPFSSLALNHGEMELLRSLTTLSISDFSGRKSLSIWKIQKTRVLLSKTFTIKITDTPCLVNAPHKKRWLKNHSC